MLVQRKNKSKTAYDTRGGKISFDEISAGPHTVYTAEVSNMVHKEIPVKQLFDIFGSNSVIKAEFIADQNFCRLSVLDGSTYSYDGAGPACKVFTSRDAMSVIDSYPTGECVDAVLCASYENRGMLTLAPYIYDWKSLPVIPKIIRALLVGLLLAIIVYAVEGTSVRDFVLFAFMLVKDNIVPLVSTFV